MSEPKPKKLNPAAERALAEAAARRAEAERKAAIAKEDAKEDIKEDPPRKGPEPTRYGDWEKKGITSDFS
jgi:hypothetical protein